MAQAPSIDAPHRIGFLATLRRDPWWIEPALVAVGLTVFLGYLTISAFLDGWAYEVGPYLSPVFEPEFAGPFDVWWFSPALLILWGPIGLRATCYYYRLAYYRSYFLTPPACAVGDFQRKYAGETRFPLVLQNIHRYFMYVALVFVPLLWIGAISGFHHPDEGWGVGLGTGLLVLNATLLMLFTFSCHSFRHFVGGSADCFSCSAWNRTRKRAWDVASVLNGNHRLFAWTSLIVIAATDLYIRLVANDIITDPNTWSSF